MSTENETNNSQQPAPSSTPTSETPAPASLVSGTSPPSQVPSQTDPVAPPTPAQPAAFTPIKVEDLKFAEGFTVSDTDRDGFLGILNDEKLSRTELAQKLVDFQASMSKAHAEAQETAWAEAQKQWQDEVRADKDVGGDKLDITIGRVAQLIDKYGSPELRGIFDMTNAGNNVHMIKFLAKIADELVESGPVSGAPAQPSASLANQLFPSMK